MLSLPGAVLVVLLAIFLAIGFLPSIIARKVKHRNKLAIYAANSISLFGPFSDQYQWIGVAGWLGCIIWALYKSQEVKVIQGPPGPAGKDAVSLSKAGVIADKHRDPIGY